MNALPNKADSGDAPTLRNVPPPKIVSPEPTPAPSKPAARLPGRRRRLLRISLLVLGPLLLLIGAGYFYVTGARYVSTDNAYVKADMASISPEISGRVTDVPVTDNENITAGQVLFRIDDQPFKLAVAQAEANLQNVRNEITALQASYSEKQAEITMAEANATYYERELKIYQDMAAHKVVAQTQLDDATHNLTVANQELPQLREALAMILAQLDGQPGLAPESHPRYLAAKAALDQAQLDLKHTVVVAPEAGVVSNVTLRPGDYVKSGTPVFSLVETGHVWVEANFKETDLTHVLPGQAATISIDTYPDERWDSTVASIRPASGAEFALLPPQNSTGNWVKVVQRITVRLAIHPQAGQPPLRAGMSAVVTIDTGHHREMPGLVKSALAWVGAGQ